MSIFTKIGGWVLGPIIRKEIEKMVDKYLKPGLDFLAGQPARIVILILTLGGIGGLIYTKNTDPVMIVTVAVVGMFAQLMNFLIQKKGNKP